MSASHPEYDEFLRGSNGPRADIQINVALGSAPADSFCQLNADDLGPKWFAAGGRRRVLTRNAFHQLNWDCILDAGFKRAELFLPVSCVRQEADGPVVTNPVMYPLDQYLLMYHMAPRQGVILHAAGAFHASRCALFLGRSGAGKSTVSRQLQANSGFRLGSDDRIIVRKVKEGHMAFGTPWPGEAKLARNESASLGALFFLHKAPKNQIVSLKSQAAFERLLPVASIPWFDPEVFPSVLEYLEKLADEVPAFDLHFRPTPEVADEISSLLQSVHGS